MRDLISRLTEPDESIIQAFWENLPSPWEQSVADHDAAVECLSAIAASIKLLGQAGRCPEKT